MGGGDAGSACYSTQRLHCHSLDTLKLGLHDWQSFNNLAKACYLNIFVPGFTGIV